MQFHSKTFSELTADELYEIIKSRSEIFVVEQGIRYQDLDGIDKKSLHCFLTDGEKVVAYLRAFYKDEKSGGVQIGRVLTTGHGAGLGRKLMEQSLAAIKEKMKPCLICCDAQSYCSPFYEKFGFVAVSDEFLEEGILHIKMEKKYEYNYHL